MPQLKKISVLPSSLLPKIENVYSSYSLTKQDNSSYIPIYCDISSANLLTSEAESDGADSLPPKPRKRQRLDHLSQEEKIMRRKLKNRVAAQTARDRKKAKMIELEEQVMELETQRKMLLIANANLEKENEALRKENTELKLRLSGKISTEVKVEKESESSYCVVEKENGTKSRPLEGSRSLEHAEGTGSANSCCLDDALDLFTSNSEADALLNLLEQCSKSLLQYEDLGNLVSNTGESRENAISTSEVVGTSSKGLESHKELIHFDHIYYKQEDISDPVVDSSLTDASELSTKDCTMNVSSSLSEDCILEVDTSSEIPVICISESSPSDLESQSDLLEFKSFTYAHFDDQVSPVESSKPVPSPVPSDGGYDSSFSVSSPGSCAANPWDDTLTELFPSLV